MNVDRLRLVALSLIVAGFTASATMAQPRYSGTCEDIFAPGYPKATDAGTALEDFDTIPFDLLKKAAADCEKRGTGFGANQKAAFAHVRLQALSGNLAVLPQLRKLASQNVAEARHLIYRLYLSAPPVSHFDREQNKLPRDVAEKELRAAAEAGHPFAVYELGRNLSLGVVVRRDLKEARVWFERALVIYEDKPAMRAVSAMELASLFQDDPEATPGDLARVASLVKIVEVSPVGAGYAKWLEIRALRLGRGKTKDIDAAKRLAGDHEFQKAALAVKAEYLELLRMSSDDADRMALLEIVETARPSTSRSLDMLAGEILYSGVPAGRDRRRALELLQTFARTSHTMAISFAERVVQSGQNTQIHPAVIQRLYEAVELNLPGAALALIKLRRSNNSSARDDVQAAELEVSLSPGYAGHLANEDVELYLLEKTVQSGPNQYWPPFGTKDGIVAALDKFIAKGLPAARRIKGIALRRGVVLRQDDVAATREIVAAAEAGDVPAFELAAEAYDEGLGIDENSAEELRWQLAAAKAGSAEAQRSLIFFLPFRSGYKGFSVHDALVSGLVLYADGLSYSSLPMGYDSVFSDRDLEDLGADYVARGLMDGFRASMAARNDDVIVSVFKKVPRDLARVVETVLKQDGHLAKEPDGFMGPEARTALISWARAKGLPEMEADKPPAPPEADARLTGVPILPPEVLDALRDKAFKESIAAKGKKAQLKALKLLALLAQYGDMAPRVAILKNYSDSSAVRETVPPAFAALYGLDVVMTEPPGAEKAPIDFIFAVSDMAQKGSIAFATDAVLYTMRDDPRFRNKAQFNKVADQFVFIPGFCDSLAARARKAGVPGVEDDGCSTPSRAALLAWAEASGPFGAEAQIRKEAAAGLLKLPQ